MTYQQVVQKIGAGGRLHIHVTSNGCKKDDDTFPDLRVTLKTEGLHAPLAERFVELPVDITAGRDPLPLLPPPPSSLGATPMLPYLPGPAFCNLINLSAYIS